MTVTHELASLLGDYIDNFRVSVTDESGRDHLFSSENGRLSLASIRRQFYILTAPCFRYEHCDGCTNSNDEKCPDAVSPHAIRRGSITHILTEDVSVEVVGHRMDVRRKVLKKHYDRRSLEVNLEQRRGYLEDIRINQLGQHLYI